MDAEITKLQGCWSGAEIASHLDRSLIPLRLAVHDSCGSPWVVSLWFLYENGALWCATNAQAKLISYLQADPQCGFEVAGETPPYKGIRGKGRATLVPERGGEILLRLLGRYGIDLDSTLAKSLLTKVEQEVAICITPSRISSWDFTTRMAGATTAI
jgi:hypothetical protein